MMIFALVVLSVICNAESAKILGVFNIASVSHQIVFQPIWKELSLRGHDVTVITPNPLRDPKLTNLKEIDLSFLYEGIKNITKTVASGADHWQFAKMILNSSPKFAEDLFSHSEVKALIQDQSKTFDVVLAEYITPFVSVFAERFKCPLIAVTSLGTIMPVHQAVGNPIHPVLYPDMITTFGDELSFFERIDAVTYYLYMYLYYYDYVYMPAIDKVIKKHFGQNTPHLAQMSRNISMLFLNTNPVLHKARPFGPSVIEMGRMHIKPKKALPKDLKEFLDDAKEGVVYFSLGSNVKSINIDSDRRNMILETFSELPYKVLWKFEDDHMANKSSNVKIGKWLPQQDLLGHPNIKLFITQAGLQSTEEAITNGVPLLALPFFGDQSALAKRFPKLGIGMSLDFFTITKEQFKSAILEIIGNPQYKAKVKEINDTLADEPNTGLERAVWWTEYVIRHKGAPYFKSPALEMPWYQYYLLDVLSVIMTTAAAVFFALYKLSRVLYAKLTISSSTKQKTS